MVWALAAQSSSIPGVNASWQVLIYLWAASVNFYEVLHIEVMTDPVIRRGNASAKTKIGSYLKATTCECGILCPTELTTRFEQRPDNEIKIVLKRNGTDYFAGYLNNEARKFDYTKASQSITLSAYCGLALLKDVTDLTQIPTDITALNALLYLLLDRIGLSINVYLYLFTLPQPGISPRGSHTGVNPQNFIDSGIENYYDFLTAVCKIFDFDIFQENGAWHVRQLIGHNAGEIYREVITANSVTAQLIENSPLSLSDNDLQYAPQKFQATNYQKIQVRTKSREENTDGKINLLSNSDFSIPGRAWQTVTGNPTYGDKCLLLNPADIVIQQTEWLDQMQQNGASAPTPFQLEVSSNCVRYVIDASDKIIYEYNNPMFAITFYVSNSVRYYYDHYTGGWVLYATEADIPGAYGRWGIPIDQYVGDPEMRYYSGSTVRTIELQTPDIPGGRIQVVLFGGAALTRSISDYPYQIPAKHNLFKVLINRSTMANNVKTKAQLVEATVSAKGETFSTEIILHDNINDLPYCIYQFGDEQNPPMEWVKCEPIWWPAYKPLIYMIAQEMLRFNSSMHYAIDAKTMSSFTCDFNSLLYDGSVYYIQVYSEVRLLRNERRLLLYPHNRSTADVTMNCVFEF